MALQAWTVTAHRQGQFWHTRQIQLLLARQGKSPATGCQRQRRSFHADISTGTNPLSAEQEFPCSHQQGRSPATGCQRQRWRFHAPISAGTQSQGTDIQSKLLESPRNARASVSIGMLRLGHFCNGNLSLRRLRTGGRPATAPHGASRAREAPSHPSDPTESHARLDCDKSSHPHRPAEGERGPARPASAAEHGKPAGGGPSGGARSPARLEPGFAGVV